MPAHRSGMAYRGRPPDRRLAAPSGIPYDRRVDAEITIVRRRAVAVGIDIGQAHDPTAIAIVSRITTEATNPALSALNPEPRPRYEVQHLERLRLGMPYPAQVDTIESLLHRAPLNRLNPRVAVDYTGVGRPVFDMFAAATRCVGRKAS